MIQIKRGQLNEAEKLLQRSLALLPEKPEHNWHLGIAHSRLAYIHNQRGKGKKAEREARLAHELLLGVDDRDHADKALLLYNRAWACLLQKDLERAEPWFVRSIAMFRRLYPDGHPDAAWPLNHYGLALMEDRPREAVSFLEGAWEIRKRFLGRSEFWRMVSTANLGIAQLQLGEFAKAEPLLLEVYELRKTGEGHV